MVSEGPATGFIKISRDSTRGLEGRHRVLSRGYKSKYQDSMYSPGQHKRQERGKHPWHVYLDSVGKKMGLSRKESFLLGEANASSKEGQGPRIPVVGYQIFTDTELPTATTAMTSSSSSASTTTTSTATVLLVPPATQDSITTTSIVD